MTNMEEIKPAIVDREEKIESRKIKYILLWKWLLVSKS